LNIAFSEKSLYNILMNIRLTFRLIISLAVLSGAFLFFNFTAAASLPVARSTVSSTIPNYSQTLPIFMYHYIETPPATTKLPGLYLPTTIFENQLQELRRYHYNPVFVSAIAQSLKAQKPLPQYSVALTFDDGYQDFYTNVFPLLKKYQMKATLYVIINALDKPDYLTTAQLKEISASSLVEIGSHTFNHLDLKTLKLKKEKFEIANSKIFLERLLGRVVPTFAYPFGSFLPAQWPVVKNIGYQAAVSVNPGVVQSENDIWFLKRVRPNNRRGIEFARWLFGLYKWKY